MLPFAPASGVLTLEELSMRLAAVERVLYDVVEQAAGLRSKTTVVDVARAEAPTLGQVLTATGPTTATWQAVPAGASPPVDGSASTPSLRTLSNTSTTACAGDDPRLADSRSPTAHGSTHQGAGSDAIAFVSNSVAGIVPASGSGADKYYIFCGDGAWHHYTDLGL